MGNDIELRNLVLNTLNTYCVDPFNSLQGSRVGYQFYTDDDINISRIDTLPKGEVAVVNNPPELSHIGKSGISKHSANVIITYYCNASGKNTIDSTLYKSKDVVRVMLKKIQDVLILNRISGYHLDANSFDSFISPEPITGSNKLYMGRISVNYMWSEAYGN